MHNKQAKPSPLELCIFNHSIIIFPFRNIYVKVEWEGITQTYKLSSSSIWEEDLAVDGREDGLTGVGDVGNGAVVVVGRVGDLVGRVGDRLDPSARQHNAEGALNVNAHILGFAFLKVCPS